MVDCERRSDQKGRKTLATIINLKKDVQSPLSPPEEEQEEEDAEEKEEEEEDKFLKSLWAKTS